MSNIRMSFGEMETAASQLGAGKEEITQKLQSMQAQIQGLVSSGFVTDRASGRFQEAFSRYTSDANNVIAHLTEIQQFLVNTANAMRELDAQIAARIA